MTAPEADDAPSHASAAHAARLIGRSERAVQGWMRDAGHAAALVPGAGYPTALLCAVVNRRKWPHQFALTPAHFAVDAVPAADAGRDARAGTTAPADALALLGEFRRMLADAAERQEALAREVAALRAQLAASDEAREKAAQTTQEALLRQEAALGRIESGQRRVPWWRRLFGG